MMRLILMAAFLFPASAWACGGQAAGGCASGHGCGSLGIALMAAVAALGTWVLRLAEKDGGYSKRAGQVVGWVFVVVGLGGFLCGAANYGMKKRNKSCDMASAESGMKLPPGHPPLVPAGK